LTPVNIEPTDRRFVVFEISDKYANSKEYFDNYYKIINDDMHLKAFYDYLMTLKVDDIDWINDRPITEAYNDMKQIESHIRFLADYEDKIFDIEGLNNVKERNINATEFLNLYFKWREEGHYGDDKMNATKFGLLMKRVDGIVKLTRESGGKRYSLDRTKIQAYVSKFL
jgi:hypothetical protein